MPKILITGANGFLGKNLCEKFEGLGCKVFCWTRKNKLAEISAFDPEYVIHAAAELYDESLMFKSNVVLTEDILFQLTWCKSLKKFIYIGSSSEYGRKSTPSKETDVLVPTTLYEATKGCGTLLSLAYGRKHGIPVSVVRPYSIYGQHEAEKRFIPTVFRCFEKGETLKVYDGAHDFLHVDDFCDGVSTVLYKDWIGNDIVNLGSGHCVSNAQLVEAFSVSIGRVKWEPVRDKLREFDTDFWCADIGYAKREYQWEPSVSLTHGLKRYAAWRLKTTN